MAASLKGLACEGQTLAAYFNIRTTSDDCPTAGGHCTAQDQEITVGSCVVTDGKCKIKVTVPSGYTPGAGAASQILGCGAAARRPEDVQLRHPESVASRGAGLDAQDQDKVADAGQRPRRALLLGVAGPRGGAGGARAHAHRVNRARQGARHPAVRLHAR